MSTTAFDWAHPRTSHAFTGYVLDPNAPKPAGLVVRFVTHTAIPVTPADMEATNQKRLIGTILGFPKLGFANAPYKKPAKKAHAKRAAAAAEAEPLPLLEVISRTGDGQTEAVRLYNFHKANSNFDKGDRDPESTSELRIGQVLTFYLNEYTFEKDVFPAGLAGVIPAFTVVDLVLNPSHNQSKGYGCKIAKITPHASTLYSYMTPAALERVPYTPDGAQRVAEEQAGVCGPIIKCVERSRYSVYSAVSPLARVVDVRDGLEFVRIECPQGSGATPVPGVHGVDIAVKDLEAFTNSPGDVVSARTFVDLAIAAGALRVFVAFDDYYNRTEPELSQYRGVPLVDAGAFLAPIKEAGLETSEDSVLFDADWRVAHDAHLQEIAFRVRTVAVSQPAGVPARTIAGDTVEPPCPDLALVSAACAYARGYKSTSATPATPRTSPSTSSASSSTPPRRPWAARAPAGASRRTSASASTRTTTSRCGHHLM